MVEGKTKELDWKLCDALFDMAEAENWASVVFLA